MRRTNAVQVRVDGPAKGLMTRTPSDLQDDGKVKYVVVAENVRAERGELQAAPGHERVHLETSRASDALAGEATLIHQPNLTSSDSEVERLPIVGTESGLYTLTKRARELVCPVECKIRFAAVADSGTAYSRTGDVAQLIKSWDPAVIVHAGDLVYPDMGTPEDSDKYETQVAQWYWWAIGGYNGPYGRGPEVNKFLPAIGNHDYDDGPGSRYFGFFNLPGNERYYTVKRGPVQFFFIDSYGYGPTASGPGGNNVAGTGAGPGVGSSDLSSTGPQAQWLQQQLAASDCPWRVVVWHHPPETSGVDYYPGYSVMNWPLGTWGADVLITGHSHVYERIHRTDGVLHIISGWGGKDLRQFVTTPVATSQVRYSDDFGAVRFDVSTTTLVAKAFNRLGVEIDTVTRTTTRTPSLCYTGQASRQATQLEVLPPEAVVPKAVAFPLQAIAHYSDGTSVDVTSLAVWSSQSTSIATVNSTGAVTGHATGSAPITAEYQGLVDMASIMVLSECLDSAHDIVLVLDRSGSMAWATPPQGSRMDRLKVAANLFLDCLFPNDRVATVSFANDPVLHHGFTSDLSASRSAVAGLEAAANTNIGDAIDEAVLELEANGRYDAKKLIVLFTDGVANMSRANSCPVDGSDIWCGLVAASTAFTTAKNQGIKCIVVTLDMYVYGPIYEAVARTWPTCPSVYFPVVDANNLAATFVKLRNEVCFGFCSSGGGIGLALI
jgi:Mg-chelatase subunit ChlD/predicted phosphodiesterase